MTITMYGIKNCDTVRAARSWMKDREVAYRFVDFRADRLQPSTVQDWFDRAGWRTVLNAGSTGYRALTDVEKAAVDEVAARSLILADPTMVKRPVLDLGNQLLLGFKPGVYEAALAAPRR